MHRSWRCHGPGRAHLRRLTAAPSSPEYWGSTWISVRRPRSRGYWRDIALYHLHQQPDHALAGLVAAPCRLGSGRDRSFGHRRSPTGCRYRHRGAICRRQGCAVRCPFRRQASPASRPCHRRCRPLASLDRDQSADRRDQSWCALHPSQPSVWRVSPRHRR